MSCWQNTVNGLLESELVVLPAVSVRTWDKSLLRKSTMARIRNCNLRYVLRTLSSYKTQTNTNIGRSSMSQCLHEIGLLAIDPSSGKGGTCEEGHFYIVVIKHPSRKLPSKYQAKLQKKNLPR